MIYKDVCCVHLATVVTGAYPYRRYLGISMFRVNQALAAELKDRNPSFPNVSLPAIYIENVHLNSPAEKAGLHSGDIIVAINGKRVSKTRDIYDALENSDSSISLLIARGSERLNVNVMPEVLNQP